MAKLMCFLALTVFISLNAAAAASRNLAPSPAPVDCSSVLLDMMDCLDYVTDMSNQTKPTKACCTGAASVAASNPVCMCAGLQEAIANGIAINMTRAASLPDACKLKVPRAEQCSAASLPLVSPPNAVPPMTSSVESSSPAKTPASSPTLEYASAADGPALSPSKSSASVLSSSSAIFLVSLILLMGSYF